MDERIYTSKYLKNHSRSRVLKSRENIVKLKCNKTLKNKLKKYKLRKDGQEDPDIIDVSQTLINSLRIKSPNKPNFKSVNLGVEGGPHNYLTKMVKLKKTVTAMETTPIKGQKSCTAIITQSISPVCKVDQEKKQTDAFRLLMDSRNKSIGTNSPGKEKCEPETLAQEKEANKELKAKRILSLNRMAEAKGSIKKIEIEEFREENIKRKMASRARKFKHMITGVGVSNEKKGQINSTKDKLLEELHSPNTSDVIVNKSVTDNKTPIFKTFDLFNEIKVNLTPNMKEMSQEDKEFLEKLSPSIRKKENMLCYFQKLSKDSDMLLDNDDYDSQNNDELKFKVKLKAQKRIIKKNNKQKVSKLTENHEPDPGTSNQENKTNILVSNDKSTKRKYCKNNELDKEISHDVIIGTMQCDNESRPKRITKKPVKYIDDFHLASSDEELHIFSPKKKRKQKSECENTMKKMIDTTEHVEVNNCKIVEKTRTDQKKCKVSKVKIVKDEKQRILPKKATKLAPIFVSRPLLDSAAIEAKQKFLHSGVPSRLKKTYKQQDIFASNEFHKVVHIQNMNYLELPIIAHTLNDIMNTKYSEDIELKEEKDLFKKLLQVPILENNSMPKYQIHVDQILQGIKRSYPKFPVYRTYHLLKGKSKGEFRDCIYPDLDNSIEIYNNMVDLNNVNPDKLNWADKYKPTTETQVIGNFESLRELKRWLVNWTENNAKSKKSKCGSDSSDFYQSDTDSREAMRNENNLLIITGKVGTGKTLSVYAVAAELAIKVIEVNASTKRTGKIMLQDLQEATQSHKVDRGKSSTECSQKSQELSTTDNLLTVTKKRGRKKKVKVNSITQATITGKESIELTVTQDNVRTGMSLILIDDADIVFDQDDGFCSAISQLIQSSKRPVILVTSSLNCPHLQKFSSLAKVIKMRPFIPRMLGTWLDIMCLADNNFCSPGLGAKILDLFKGDIRKTINYLQFYMTSHTHLCNIDNPSLIQDEVTKVDVDDENSCMSWGNTEAWSENNFESNNSNDDCNSRDVNKETQLLHFCSPLTNFNIWWNLPNVLNYSPKLFDPTFENGNKAEEIKKLDNISTVLDNMSVSDYLERTIEESNITSRPWQSFQTDSVIDRENFSSYSRNSDFLKEISWELMIKHTAEAQGHTDPENKTEMNYPSMSMQRERDRVVSRHNNLTSCLTPSTVLDRRALALDYWSSCRSICRTEKSKTNNSSKRNNRFCHYLKSLNIVCRNEYFDNLGDSLTFKK